jgi:hypothetical protein
MGNPGAEGPAGPAGPAGSPYYSTYGIIPTYTASAWSPVSGLAAYGASASPTSDLNLITQSTLPSACTLKNLSIRVSRNIGGYGGNDTLVFSIMHNGTITALSCTLTVNSSSTTTCTDTTHTVPAAAGDLFAFYFVDTNAGDADNTPFAYFASSVACD